MPTPIRVQDVGTYFVRSLLSPLRDRAANSSLLALAPGVQYLLQMIALIQAVEANQIEEP